MQIVPPLSLCTSLCIVAAFVAAQQRNASGGKLSRIIGQLEAATKSETTLYYHESSRKSIFSIDFQPKLILNANATFELWRSFKAVMLAVVVPGEINNQHGALKNLEKNLKKLRGTIVVFVVEPNRIQAYFWLFHWAAKNGFSNALLTDFAGAQLYTFRPLSSPLIIFPTDLYTFLLQVSTWHRNLQGHQIRVSAGNSPPRAYVYTARNGEFRFNGLRPSIVKLFVERINASMEIVVMPHFESYAIADCIRAVNAGTVDICADVWQMSDEVATSTALYLQTVYMIVPFSQPIAKFYYFLKPFMLHVWLLIAIAVVYTALLLSLAQRQRTKFCNFSYFLLEVWCSVLFIGFNLSKLDGGAKFVVKLLLVAFGLVVTTFYFTTLSSFFATNLYEAQINTFEDVRARNLTLLVKCYDRKVLKLYGAPTLLEHQIVEMDAPAYYAHFSRFDPQYVYFKAYDKVQFYFYQQKFLIRPRVKIIEKPFFHVVGGFPLKANWPLEHVFNLFTLRLCETGHFDEFLRRTTREAIHEGQLKFMKTEYFEVKPLNMAYFQMPAILWTVGHLAAFVCFAIESMWKGCDLKNRFLCCKPKVKRGNICERKN